MRRRVEGLAPAIDDVFELPEIDIAAAVDALGAVRDATLVDAVVTACAALRGGGVVYSSDVDDLSRLQRHFPNVGLLAV